MEDVKHQENNHEESVEKINEEDIEIVNEEETADETRETGEGQAVIDQLRSEKEAAEQRVLRVQADFENFKRRSNDERLKERKFRSQDIVKELLPALDNFERALQTETPSADGQSLKQGMEMVFRQMKEALEKEGVSVIEALGEAFDPNLHQAVMQIESEEHPSNTVIEVLQNGYVLNERVLRPAMVKVNA